MLRTRSIISCLIIAASALAVILTSTALSQTFRGGISGSVVDSNGAAIAGATVRLLNEGTGLARNQETTSAGEFNFPDLQVGLYTLSITKQGFQTQKLQKVEVAVGKVTSLSFTLAIGQTTETVEVQAAAATLETQSTTLNAVVNQRAVQEIPLNGRDFRTLLYLTPGYNQSGSMNGNRASQNNWQIDGTDNNDFWHNSEAVNQGSISGIAGVLLPIESIDQFNQQAAGNGEFGRNPGSMVTSRSAPAPTNFTARPTTSIATKPSPPPRRSWPSARPTSCATSTTAFRSAAPSSRIASSSSSTTNGKNT